MRNINERYVDETYDKNGVLQTYAVHYPDDFNFGYDIVDGIAVNDPQRRAMVWCNPEGEEHTFTFADMKAWSDKTANFLAAQGIGRGDFVMVILRRHYQFWMCALALHKIGAIAIPATHLLTAKDIRYRVQSAEISVIICTAHNTPVSEAVLEAAPDCPTLKHLVLLRGEKEGFESWEACFSAASESWEKPVGEAYPCNEDIMLVYFTSGTTGQPKMVAHNFFYPLGHIITAIYWQQVEDGGLHLTVSETGWAKSVWGKLYGQWLGGSTVFVYDFDKFKGAEILEMISKFRITTYCSPPTMYRFMLQEDFSRFDLSSLRHCSVAGEPLSPEIANDWKNQTGIELHECFGQTELVATLCTFPWMKVCPGSMGKPAPLFDVDLVDSEGNLCPRADNQVLFQLSGATIAGVDNGCQTSLERFKADNRHAFNGKCLVVIRADRLPGTVTLTAKSPDLKTVSLTLKKMEIGQ